MTPDKEAVMRELATYTDIYGRVVPSFDRVEEAMKGNVNPEIKRLMVMYAGADQWKPRDVAVTPFSDFDDSWPAAEFQALINGAISKIPDEYKSSVQVTRNEYSIEITYFRPETPTEFAIRIGRSLQYAETSLANDQAVYEKVKLRLEQS